MLCDPHDKRHEHTEETTAGPSTKEVASVNVALSVNSNYLSQLLVDMHRKEAICTGDISLPENQWEVPKTFSSMS
jgi:hypothetical protein